MASTAGSALPTVLVARDTLGLAALGMLTMFFEALRLVLCRLRAGSGVLLRGISGSLMTLGVGHRSRKCWFNNTTLQML